jgi:hypothetical protein
MSTESYKQAHSITPSDSIYDLVPKGKCRAIYVGNGPNGVTADITIKTPEANYNYADSTSHHGVTGGTVVKFGNWPVGTILPVVATHVKSTGTDATEIVGLY